MTYATPTAPARRHRSLRLAALLGAAALALSGCMKIDMEFELHEDDTASGAMVMAFADSFAESMGMEPQDLWDQMGEDAAADAPPGSVSEPYAQDGYTGVRYVFDSVPLAEMSSDDGTLDIVREGDEFVVSGLMDMSEEAMGTEGTETDEATQAIMDAFVVRFAITFPGEVSSHNGTLDGTTVTWEPAMGEITEMSARGSAIAGGSAGGGAATEDGDEDTSATTEEDTSVGAGEDTTAGTADEGSSGLPAWLLPVAGGVLALLAVAIVVTVVVSRKRAAATAPAAAAYGPPTGQPYPGQQPYQAAPPAPQGYPAAPPAPQAYPPAPQAYPPATQAYPPAPQAYPPAPPAPPAQQTPPPPPPA